MVDAVVGVVAGQGGIAEDSGGSIQLQLQLGSQSALEVDGPQRLVLGDGHALDFAVDDFDLERLLDVFLVDDAALGSRIGFDQLRQNVFVEHLGLGDSQLDVDGALIDGLDDQTTFNGSAGNLGAQTEHSGGDEALVVVFVGATTPPD